MALLSLIVVLLIEQLRPQQDTHLLSQPVKRLIAMLERRFNAGHTNHGALSWLLLVLPAGALVAAVFYLLLWINPVLAWLWNLLVLYFTLGFRQFSHFYTDIHMALRLGDVPRARQLLAEWRGIAAPDLNSTEVARLAIEEALLACHRHVFAPVVFFVIFPGPSGAVLYWLAALLNDQWGRRSDEDFGAFGEFAARAFALLDWLPRRITAFSFAVVGDFEDAVWCWRTQAEQWLNEPDGIILSAGAGALGVRLGDPVQEGGRLVARPEIGLGDEPDADIMQGGIGLVWRTLVLWLLLLALFGVAGWVGG